MDFTPWLIYTTDLLSCDCKAEHFFTWIQIQFMYWRKGVLQLNSCITDRYLHSCWYSAPAAHMLQSTVNYGVQTVIMPLFLNNLCSTYTVCVSSHHPRQYKYQWPVISWQYWSGYCVHPCIMIKYSMWPPCVNVCYLIWMCCPTFWGSAAQPDYF